MDLLDKESGMGLEVEKSSIAVIIAGRNDMRLQLPGATSVTVTDEYVIIVSDTDTGSHISVYRKSDLYTCNGTDSQTLQYNSFFTQMGKVGLKSNPSVLCVFSQEEELTAKTDSSCKIQKELYNDLFHMDANLIDSPIILVGYSNGCVYAYTLKGGNTNQGSLICDLGKPIVGIHGMNISDCEAAVEHSGLTDICNSLVFVGAGGRVMMVTTQDVIKYQDVQVASSIVCTAVYDHYLVYSTLTGLYAVDMTTVQTPGDVALSTVDMGLAGIVKLASLYTKQGKHIFQFDKK